MQLNILVCIIVAATNIYDVKSFIPERCRINILPCRCRFPDRPLVSCRANLTSVPSALGENKADSTKKIHTLDLSHNRIYRIPSRVCAKCIGLRRLDLSHNRISLISRTAFLRSWWMTHLEYLDLSYNEIELLSLQGVENLISLETLKLDNNKIMTISSVTFQRMETLSKLTLHGNKLIGCHINGPPLKSISLSFVVNALSITLPTGIEELFIVSSRFLLDSAVIVSTKKFQSLALQDSRLNASSVLRSTLLNDTHDLMHLSLKRNRISSNETEFSQLIDKVKDVEYLDLSYNLITEIKSSTFGVMNKLMTLNLSSNKISKIDWVFIVSLPRLQALDLSNNQISTSVGMKDPLLALTNLNTLKVGGNPFNCNCEDIGDIQKIIEISSLENPGVLDYSQIIHSLTCKTSDTASEKMIFEFYMSSCLSV